MCVKCEENYFVKILLILQKPISKGMDLNSKVSYYLCLQLKPVKIICDF